MAGGVHHEGFHRFPAVLGHVFLDIRKSAGMLPVNARSVDMATLCLGRENPTVRGLPGFLIAGLQDGTHARAHGKDAPGGGGFAEEVADCAVTAHIPHNVFPPKAHGFLGAETGVELDGCELAHQLGRGGEIAGLLGTVMTRSRCFSPRSSSTVGQAAMIPHFAAIFRMRRRQRRAEFTEEIARPVLSRNAP